MRACAVPYSQMTEGLGILVQIFFVRFMLMLTACAAIFYLFVFGMPTS